MSNKNESLLNKITSIYNNYITKESIVLTSMISFVLFRKRIKKSFLSQPLIKKLENNISILSKNNLSNIIKENEFADKSVANKIVEDLETYNYCFFDSSDINHYNNKHVEIITDEEIGANSVATMSYLPSKKALCVKGIFKMVQRHLFENQIMYTKIIFHEKMMKQIYNPTKNSNYLRIKMNTKAHILDDSNESNIFELPLNNFFLMANETEPQSLNSTRKLKEMTKLDKFILIVESNVEKDFEVLIEKIEFLHRSDAEELHDNYKLPFFKIINKKI